MGAFINRAIFTTSCSPLQYLIGDTAEPQAINCSSIFMSEYLCLQGAQVFTDPVPRNAVLLSLPELTPLFH